MLGREEEEEEEEEEAGSDSLTNMYTCFATDILEQCLQN
jgi:hypothetical protein